MQSATHTNPTSVLKHIDPKLNSSHVTLSNTTTNAFRAAVNIFTPLDPGFSVAAKRTIVGRHVGAHPKVNNIKLKAIDSRSKMVLRAIIGCGTRRVRDKGVYMARIPAIITNQGEEMRELTEERRKAWILAISREDLTDSILEHGRVCLKHFVSGRA